MSVDLSIIIVNWNTRELLAQCLESIARCLESRPPTSETFVIDNASTDSSVAIVTLKRIKADSESRRRLACSATQPDVVLPRTDCDG